MNLRERAHFAYLDETRAAEAWIIARATRAISAVIGEPVEDYEVVSTDATADTAVVEFKFGGLDFKVTVVSVERKMGGKEGSNAGLEYDEETIRVFVCRYAAWMPVGSLADIGKLFRLDPLPDSVADEATP